MKKSIITLAMAVLGLASIQAEQLSPAQALARLQSEGSGPQRAAGSGLQAAPVFTSETDGSRTFYVFNSQAEKGGYVIVAADDVAAPMLGYADEGAFDPDNIPANMAWWLGEYAREIKWAIDNAQPGAQPKATAPRAARNKIAPMVTSRWNQGDPYNQDCPTVGGNRCVTGCVATAMAQIMYYHKWPQSAGSGSISYEWNNTTLSMDFSQTRFDWANMIDEYTSSSTSAQKAAVAKLMKACGYSTKMGYGTDASGTQSSLIAWALTEYFDYDKGIQTYSRNAFTKSDWDTMIYNELAAKRPVQYSGRTLGGEGHAFVCDGYNDGYFHINWGWGGSSDGYFLTSALDPSSQGIGGSQSNDAFVTDQRIIVGIQKNKGTAQRPAPYLELYGNFLPSKTQYLLHENVELGGQPGNSGYTDFVGTVGLKIVKVSGGDPVYVNAFDIPGLPAGYYYNSDYTETVNAQNICVAVGFAETDYIVSLAYRSTGGQWQDCVASPSKISKLKMTLTSDRLVFDYAPDEISLSITSPTAITPLYIYRNFSLKATATVQSEYNSTLQVYFFQPGTNEVYGLGGEIHYTIEPGSQEIAYTSMLYRNSAKPNFPAGTYEMAFIDITGKEVSQRKTVTLEDDPGSPVISFSNLRVISSAKNNIKFAGNITCTSGYFYDSMGAFIFPENGGNSLGWLGSGLVSVKKGETKEFVASGAFMSGTVGTTYAVLPYYNNTLYQDKWTYFVLAEEEGEEPVLPVTGDVNGDMVVNNIDAQVTASFIMGGAVDATFDEERADLNGDGDVSGIDVVTIVSLMGQNLTTPYASPSSVASLAIADIQAETNAEATVAVKATANGPILGFQCDIDLPEGVEMVEGSLSLAKPQGQTLDMATVGGKLRLLAYSLDNKPLLTSGGNTSYTGDAIFTFKVKASTALTGEIKITGAELDAKSDAAPVMLVCSETSCTFTAADPEVPVSSVSLSPSALSLEIGQTAELMASVEPSNATNTELTWTVSDPSVASLDGTTVTALSEGTATITATSANGLSASCEVTVSAPALKEQTITWTQEFEGISEGDEIALQASASSGLEVVYTITEGASLAQLSGNMLKVLSSGTIKVKAEQPGDSEYAPAEPVVKEIIALMGLASASADQAWAKADGGSIVICSPGEAEIYTASGRLVYRGNDSRVDVAAGVYIVRLGSKVVKVVI